MTFKLSTWTFWHFPVEQTIVAPILPYFPDAVPYWLVKLQFMNKHHGVDKWNHNALDVRYGHVAWVCETLVGIGFVTVVYRISDKGLEIL